MAKARLPQVCGSWLRVVQVRDLWNQDEEPAEVFVVRWQVVQGRRAAEQVGVLA